MQEEWSNVIAIEFRNEQRSSRDRPRGNSGERRVVIGVLLLKNIHEPFAARYVKSLPTGIEEDTVQKSHSREIRHLLKGRSVVNDNVTRRPCPHEDPAVGCGTSGRYLL